MSKELINESLEEMNEEKIEPIDGQQEGELEVEEVVNHNETSGAEVQAMAPEVDNEEAIPGPEDGRLLKRTPRKLIMDFDPENNVCVVTYIEKGVLQTIKTLPFDDPWIVEVYNKWVQPYVEEEDEEEDNEEAAAA